MIAATAIAADLPIYTCNPDDFSGIEDLEVVVLPIPPAR
jgi:tRNA(fMet)-specific endonuclease VapC